MNGIDLERTTHGGSEYIWRISPHLKWTKLQAKLAHRIGQHAVSLDTGKGRCEKK